MALQKDEKVQRGHAFAVVDEVDSVLIDEARTPLIISGAVDAPVDETFTTLKPGVQGLVKKQSSLVSDLVREAQKYIDDGDEDNAGLKLLQAQRGMPKNRQAMKIFQEPGMLKLAQDIESIYTRDKKMHEVQKSVPSSMNASKIAILAAMNISDELFGARRGEYSFKGEVESKVKSLIERIEEITD